MKSNLWWSFRKSISENTRFKVASKEFLEAKEVYKAYESLSPSKASLLAKHLEADILITLSLDNREFHIRSYSEESGLIFNHQSLKLQNTSLAEDQIGSLIKPLVAQWIAELPSQAKIISLKNAQLLVDLGMQTNKNENLKEAYLVKVQRKSLGPLVKDNYQREILSKLIWSQTDNNEALYKIENQQAIVKDKLNLYSIWLPKVEKEQRKIQLGEKEGVPSSELLHLMKPEKEVRKKDDFFTRMAVIANLLIILAFSI